MVVLRSDLSLSDPLLEALAKTLDGVHTLETLRVYCYHQSIWVVEDLVKRIDSRHSYDTTLKYCQRDREVRWEVIQPE
jgi:hypothetical protein